MIQSEAVPSDVGTVVLRATKLAACGFSVLPIKGDKSKAPGLPSWKPLQSAILPPDAIKELFEGRKGIGVVCGSVSGGLEVIDIDDPDLVEPWKQLVEEQCPGLLARLPEVKTPRDGGGLHVYFRSAYTEKSLKLARDPARVDLPRKNGHLT